jgi:hypothetical protein
MNYTYDNIGQLKVAQGFESSGTPRLHVGCEKERTVVMPSRRACGTKRN